MRPHFMLCMALASIGIARPSSDITFDETIDSIRGLKQDLSGFYHLADDGVARSYNGQGEVIDAVRLSREHLLAYASHASTKEDSDHLKDIWSSAASEHVPENEIWNPKFDILPPQLKNPGQSGHDSGGKSPRSQDSPLEKRQNPYCLSQPCTTHDACIFMGCAGCAQIDQIIAGMVCV